MLKMITGCAKRTVGDRRKKKTISLRCDIIKTNQMRTKVTSGSLSASRSTTSPNDVTLCTWCCTCRHHVQHLLCVEPAISCSTCPAMSYLNNTEKTRELCICKSVPHLLHIRRQFLCFLTPVAIWVWRQASAGGRGRIRQRLLRNHVQLQSSNISSW